MLAAVQKPAINPHLAGALGVILLISGVAGGIFAFGNPDATRPTIRVAAPEPAPDTPVLDSSFRGDAVSLDDPALDQIADINSADAEPSLDGVAPINPDAPVRTRAELAEQARRNARALPSAPLPGLTQDGPGGPLPIISDDGLRPSDAYKRPFAADDRPKVALIVGGLGMSRERTRRAIETLPPEITLAFVPYAEDLQNWVDLAREYGHEVLLEIPMEPFDYPQNDPGPHTLLTNIDQGENLRRLEWLLSRTTGYFGVTNYLGAKLATSEDAMRPILDALNARGLAFIHDGAAARSPIGRAARRSALEWTSADRVIDTPPAPASIDEQLLQLEALALQNGAALGAGFAYPVTLEQARSWAGGLESKGYALAPASAVLAERREP